MRLILLTLEWSISKGLVDYNEAETFMDGRVKALQDGTSPECVWLLEHSPLYTLGTSADSNDLLNALDLPIHKAGRGGKYTYHGPGQRVCYLMLDLGRRDKDIKRYVAALEQWGIDTLALCGIKAFQDDAGIGLWVDTPSGQSKIAAIGVRVSKWVTKYGISFNLCPNLDHYKGIIPCGIKNFGVTSLNDLGIHVTTETFDQHLKDTFRF